MKILIIHFRKPGAFVQKYKTDFTVLLRNSDFIDFRGTESIIEIYVQRAFYERIRGYVKEHF